MRACLNEAHRTARPEASTEWDFHPAIVRLAIQELHSGRTRMTNVAINGLGRIGRATLKILMDTPDLYLVAANDIGASDSVEYLLKYDTVYGRYEKAVEATDDGHLKIGDHR